MFKKLTTWIFFTIFAGLLPIGLKWGVFGVTNQTFTYSTVCSEVFFFNIILSADGLKMLYDIDSEKKLKILLYASLVFILIIISVVYGILLV